MMNNVNATILIIAIVAAVGNGATVMDTPLPFSIFPEFSRCSGNPLSTGVITSVKPLRKNGNFCENTIQKTSDGNEITVFTKIKFTSCDAVPMGYAILDSFTCTDSECSDCTDTDNLPVQASLILPKFSPLPEADACWGVEATTMGTKVFNQFDAMADPESIDTYWQVYIENSCLKDTIEISSAPSTFTSLVALTAMGILLVALLLN